MPYVYDISACILALSIQEAQHETKFVEISRTSPTPDLYIEFTSPTTETDQQALDFDRHKRVVETRWKSDTFGGNNAGVLLPKERGHRFGYVQPEFPFMSSRQRSVE